ncbi:MAG TPA: ATP-binding protein [Candidatus Limnocylindrales bacterium]|nr:ATP-binding protein [Candidatus Limnocylindrales bacterium]
MREWLPPSISVGPRLSQLFGGAKSDGPSGVSHAPDPDWTLTHRDRIALAVGGLAVFVAALAAITGADDLFAMQLTVAIGLILLVGGSWWLKREWAGEPLGQAAIPVAVATATPLLLFPLTFTWSSASVFLYFAIGIASIVQLGMFLAGQQRLRIGLAIRALLGRAGSWLVPAALILFLVVWVLLQLLSAESVFGLLAALCVVVPGGFLIVEPALARAVDDRLNPNVTAGLAVATLSPAIAWFSVWASQPYNLNLWPIVAWAVVLVGARHLTIQPLLRTAQRATLQRDVVVAAMEAERSRLAADLHDDALQDLTLLVRRLDAAGDMEGAEMARHVAERLRAICGDLRLPILDDLGAGPALEWLVERIERLAGGEVRLERNDPVRPPADVELAVFRVAQEALANAVRHGRPPIVVRYLTGPGTTSLSIDDAGEGIDAEAADRAPEAGHFGLLNMRQRAEAIGAILEIRRWPRGGTHVGLDWRGG